MIEETPINMLKADHRKVEKLFDDFYGETENDERSDIAEKIFKELRIHMQLEEEMLYPMIEQVSSEGEKMGQHARQDHQKVKEIIASLKKGDEIEVDESKMREMNALLADHIAEEEDEVFPFAGDNLKEELGLTFSTKMLALKEKLRMQM